MLNRSAARLAGRGRRVVAAAIVVAASATGVLAAGPAPVEALPRTESDRPDDLDRPQIHLVYAIPSDGVDNELDTNGTLERSTATFNRWLRQQTPGRALRIDTFAGQADVTFYRSFRNGAELATYEGLATVLGDDLAAAGFDDPDKKYAVYYDGPSVATPCGGAAWPPDFAGQAAVMYLQSSCAQPLTSSASGGMGYREVAMVHDLLHTLGIVGDCAPNHGTDDNPGHVTNDPADLMWAGAGAWLPSGPRSAQLDIGRDDYYQHSIPGCPDLDDSPYLTSEAYPISRAIHLTPVRLRVGTSAGSNVEFKRTFASVAEVCFDLAIIGDPPGPDVVSLQVDRKTPPLTGTPGPVSGGTSPIPQRALSLCMSGASRALELALFRDGRQSITVTTTTGSVDVRTLGIRLLGVPTDAGGAKPSNQNQVFSTPGPLTPDTLRTGETSVGSFDLGPTRFSVLDEICFRFRFADDLFEPGDELRIQVVGRPAPPLLIQQVGGPTEAERERCVFNALEPAALATFSSGGTVHVAVTATQGSVAIRDLYVVGAGSRDPG